MSDIIDFRPHEHLQHRVLEAVVFQWDGTQEQAMSITAELQRELKMRDGFLKGSTFSGDISSRVSRSSGQVDMTDKRTWTIQIGRLSDGDEWTLYLAPHDWLVIWLHEERLHFPERMEDRAGERLFRPLRPVVRLQPRHPEVDGA